MRYSLCHNCQKVFPLSKKDNTLIERLQPTGQTFIMLECPECGLGTHFSPPGFADKISSTLGNPQYRCPTPRCTGWVCQPHIPHSPNSLWGCGECGVTWPDISALHESIEKAVAAFPHRKNCYLKTKEGWIPNSPNSEDRKYERKVEQESPTL